MSTLKARVEDYTGAVSDTAALDQWLKEGARVIIHALPDGLLWQVSTSSAVASGGYAISNSRILAIHKTGRPAIRIPASMSAVSTDDNSIFRATDFSPIYHFSVGKLFIEGATSGGTVEYVSFPTPLNTDSVITGFPVDLDHLVVLFSAARVQSAKAYTEVLPTQPSAASAPPAPTLAVISYTVPVYQYPQLVVIPAPPVDLSLSLPTAPAAYSPPTVTLPAVPTIAALSLSGISVPSAPSAPSISYVDASAGAISATSVAALPAVPAFSSPVFAGDLSTIALPTDLDLTKKLDGITSLAFPSVPSSPVITSTDAVASTASAPAPSALGTAPVFTKPTFGGSLSIPSLPTLDLTKEIDESTVLDPPALPSSPSFVSSGISDVSITALPAPPSYVKIAAVASRSTWTGFKDDEDPELMLHSLNEVESQVNENRLNVQEEINSYNQDVEIYRQTVARDIEAARIQLQERTSELNSSDQLSLQDYIQELSLYDKKIVKYNAEINRVLQKYQLAFDAAVNPWAQEQRLHVENYRTDIQNESERLRGSIVSYETDARHKIEIARQALEQALSNSRSADNIASQNEAQSLQALVADWQGDVAKWEIDLSSYKEQANIQLQQFDANLRKGLDLYMRKQENYLRKFNMDIDSENAAFQGKMQDHQGEIQRLVVQAQLDQQRLTSAAGFTTDTNVKNEAETLRASISDYELGLRLYSAEIQGYAAQVDATIREYQADEVSKQILMWQTEASQIMKVFESDIQNETQQMRADLDLYSKQLESVLREFTEKTGRDVSLYQAEANITLGAFKSDLDSSLADFESSVKNARLEIEDKVSSNQVLVTSYQSDVASYQVSAQDVNTRYQGALGKYAAARQGYIADATLLMQTFTNELQAYTKTQPSK